MTSLSCHGSPRGRGGWVSWSLRLLLVGRLSESASDARRLADNPREWCVDRQLSRFQQSGTTADQRPSVQRLVTSRTRWPRRGDELSLRRLGAIRASTAVTPRQGRRPAEGRLRGGSCGDERQPCGRGIEIGRPRTHRPALALRLTALPVAPGLSGLASLAVTPPASAAPDDGLSETTVSRYEVDGEGSVEVTVTGQQQARQRRLLLLLGLLGRTRAPPDRDDPGALALTAWDDVDLSDGVDDVDTYGYALRGGGAADPACPTAASARHSPLVRGSPRQSGSMGTPEPGPVRVPQIPACPRPSPRVR